MSRPTIIIPAAGNSRRFKDVGINTPKGMLRFKWRGQSRTMIGHVLDGLDHLGCELLVNAVWDGWSGYSGSGLLSVGATQGQADTVRLALQSIGPDRPVLILNSDCGFTYPLDRFLKQAQNFEATALVFPGCGDTAYSYVDQFPMFSHGYEKQPISSWALAGAFYFHSSEVLLRAIREQMTLDIRHAGEFYLSEALGFYPGDKLAVAMERRQLHVWGTPEDLARDSTVVIEDPTVEAILATLR